MNLLTKQKETQGLREQTYGCQGEDGGKGQLGSLDQHAHIAILKMDNQQGSTVQHTVLCSMLCAAWMGGEFEAQ